MYLVCRFLSLGLQHTCRELILPLPPQDTRQLMFMWRQADEPHITALAEALGVQITIFSVRGKDFVKAVYPGMSSRTEAGLMIRLVLHSEHYDLVYV